MNLLLKQGDPIPQILSTNISAFEWNPICVFIMATSKLMTQNRSGHIYIQWLLDKLVELRVTMLKMAWKFTQIDLCVSPSVSTLWTFYYLQTITLDKVFTIYIHTWEYIIARLTRVLHVSTHLNSKCSKHRKFSKMRPKTQNWKWWGMVGGRSGKLRNVPPDFLRRFRNNFGRYLVCIGDAEVGEVQAFCCILTEISRCIEIPQKCARKPKIESYEKLSGDGQDTSAMFLRTSYESSGPSLGDTWPPSVTQVAAKLC